MKILALLPLLFLASAFATEATKPIQPAMQVTNTGPIELKNGSYVFINEDNTMHMTDRNGHPVNMKNGVEMELKDGGLIMMNNKHLWHKVNPRKLHDHQKMK